MQRTGLTKAIGLVAVLFVLGAMMMGCRASENKYVGIYVFEEELARGKRVVKLEIKRDGTYTYETGGPYVESHEITGEWRVIKVEGEEGIDFTPFLPLLFGESREKGYYFHHPVSGDILVKQKATAIQKREIETRDKPKPRIRQSGIVGTYFSQASRSPRFFIELREDNTASSGGFGRWEIETRRYPYQDGVEYKIVLMSGGGTDYGYIEGDTITALDVGLLMKQEGAELIRGGQGKLWSAYVDQKQKVVLKFKEDNATEVGYLYKWERKGDVIRFYEKGKKEPEVELEIKGKTLVMPNGLIFVKQE